MLAGFLHDMVLKHRSLEAAISYFLANKLASPYLTTTSLRDVIFEALQDSADIRDAIRKDLEAVVERDPAARSMALPFLYFKGFQALQSYRAAHWLWNQDRKPLALYLQSRISEAFDVDIHPAARIGKEPGSSVEDVLLLEVTLVLGLGMEPVPGVGAIKLVGPISV